ncbi:DUF4232 domain-containing protein [Actinomadura sp. NEAU-AAG7]|uniref:DUF4232 domain-containing protein n=1 Tax=Actinomadura sp. NEAU-AAG7 TaxID=2839640 RepID=UPI001BE49EB7|nr:DUF4232 domain-containing protein [Actinomadura sp. NEAU-AAG7]MBT2213894.1 DUF4232 domain-containing protein [Actinomadura sp. NEAU-AAG7]
MKRIIWGTIATAATATALTGFAATANAGQTTTGQTTTGQAATGRAAPHCTTSKLKASLSDFDAGAGQRYLTLALTNISKSACTTGGWSGLGQADAKGAIPTTTVREGKAHTITIPAGHSAYEVLHWAAVPADDETGDPCEPVPTTLRVIPPNETTRLTAPWNYGAVCQHGSIRLTPLTLTHP